MFNLVLKDLMIQKRFFLTAFLYYLIGNLLFYKHTMIVFVIIPAMVACRWITNACSCEYKNNSDILINSLPVDKKDIIYAKYISIFVFTIVGICISIIVSFILRIFGLGNVGKIINFKDALLCFGSIMIYICVYFPVYFKLGYLKSRDVAVILDLIIFLIPFLLIFVQNKMKITEFILSLNSYNNFIISIFIIGILFLLGGVSVFISNRIYINKDL